MVWAAAARHTGVTSEANARGAHNAAHGPATPQHQCHAARRGLLTQPAHAGKGTDMLGDTELHSQASKAPLAKAALHASSSQRYMAAPGRLGVRAGVGSLLPGLGQLLGSLHGAYPPDSSKRCWQSCNRRQLLEPVSTPLAPEGLGSPKSLLGTGPSQLSLVPSIQRLPGRCWG